MSYFRQNELIIHRMLGFQKFPFTYLSQKFFQKKFAGLFYSSIFTKNGFFSDMIPPPYPGTYPSPAGSVVGVNPPSNAASPPYPVTPAYGATLPYNATPATNANVQQQPLRPPNIQNTYNSNSVGNFSSLPNLFPFFIY